MRLHLEDGFVFLAVAPDPQEGGLVAHRVCGSYTG